MKQKSVIHCRTIALQVDQTADEVMQRMQDLDAISLDSEAFIALSTFAGPIYVRAIDIVAIDAIPQALDQMDEPPDGSVAIFQDSADGGLIPMKRMDGAWRGLMRHARGTWSDCLREFGVPVQVVKP